MKGLNDSTWKKYKRSHKYFDKTRQTRSLTSPVFFESNLDWIYFERENASNPTIIVANKFLIFPPPSYIILHVEVLNWHHFSIFQCCRSSISTTSSATSSSTGSHWTSNSANKLSKVCVQFSPWFETALTFFVQLGRRLRESCRSLKPRPVRTWKERKKKKRERENWYWMYILHSCVFSSLSSLCEKFDAQSQRQVRNSWTTVTCQFRFSLNSYLQVFDICLWQYWMIKSTSHPI